MKSKIFLVLLTFILLFSFKSQAQLPHASIFVHALYASALDKNSQAAYNGGLGANGGVTIGTSRTRLVGTIGYTNFFGASGVPDEHYIPLKLGVRKYLPLTLHKIFLQGDLGAGFLSNKDAGNTDTRFAADIGAGVHLAGLDAALVFDGIDTPHNWSTWVNFELGFNLGF